MFYYIGEMVFKCLCHKNKIKLGKKSNFNYTEICRNCKSVIYKHKSVAELEEYNE